MKYFSTFSGIGGFELGIIKAYVDSTNRGKNRGKQKDKEANAKKGNRLESSSRKSSRTTKRQTSKYFKHRSYGGEPHCVGFSEIDKYAAQIYQKHFPEHKNYGDITKINANTLPDFDLLVGGFPCQAFSIAGKRKGFEDTRGTLFFDLARILRAKKPRLFVFENVKGLLSHDNGKTFRTIIGSFDELGYDCEWQVLNSKNHGVPQNRERVFIIGHLRGTRRPKVFPFGEESIEDSRRVGKEISYTIDANYHKGTNTITKSRRQVIKKDMRIRKLTPVECERLQGFPDNWTENGLLSIMEVCVNTNNVIEEQLLELDSVSCTTKDGKDMEVQICKLEKKEFANIVIDQPLLVSSAIDIINPLSDTVTLFNQNETLSIDELIKQKDIYGQMGEKSTCKLWKVTLAGNYSKEKLYIILTSILEIMKSLTSTSAKTDENIIGVIIHLNSQGQSYLKEGSLILKMASIEFVSDTQRYKCCGNAVTVNVIRDIFDKILD